MMKIKIFFDIKNKKWGETAKKETAFRLSGNPPPAP